MFCLADEETQVRILEGAANLMPESDNLKKYRALELERQKIARKFGVSSTEYDDHIDKMDKPWYGLTIEEMRIINEELTQFPDVGDIEAPHYPLP